jgi:SAM-dependent methyltransferase
MTDDRRADETARTFFEALWQRGDPWELEASGFERARYARVLAALEGRRYPSALELGCGAGTFTRMLAGLADRIVAVDISATAIARARALVGADQDTIEFRAANIMDVDLRKESPWDLVVLSETIYYLGWLYPFCNVAWLAAELFATTRDGGRLLLVNTESGVDDGLIRPWLVRTYRDLFVNVGFALEREEVFRGMKDGATIDVLISLFTKAGDAS